MRERHPQHARVGACRNSRCLKPSGTGATAPTRVDSPAALTRHERTDMTRRLSVVVLAAAVSGCTPFSASRTRTTAPSERAARPVLFERNDGQAARTYRFVAHGPAFDAGFTAHGVVLATNDRHVAFDFVGAAEDVVSGGAPLAEHFNHLCGLNAPQRMDHRQPSD